MRRLRDYRGDENIAGVVRFIDWLNVSLKDSTLSGAALRRIAVPRPNQHAVDESRWRSAEEAVKCDILDRPVSAYDLP
jgi:hypothetical protein